MNRVLVTGACGFVGRHLVRALAARGDEVVALDVQPGAALAGVRALQADLRDPAAVRAACAGVDTVFHVASMVRTRHTRAEDVHAVNVGGTRNVLAACHEQGVARLVYVSSASVVYEGRDIERGDEGLPYAARFPAPYVQSKRIAEEEVLSASGRGGLSCCAIRPHVIFGPGDTRLLPTILHRARQGKLRFSVGRGDKLSDFTYIDNLVDALLQAQAALAPGGPAGGQAYFVTNGEPIPFWDFVRRVVGPLGYPLPRLAVPFSVAYAAAALREATDALRGREIDVEDGLSRFAIRYICTHHYFSHDKATRDLGYRPRVSLSEGITRTVAALIP